MRGIHVFSLSRRFSTCWGGSCTAAPSRKNGDGSTTAIPTRPVGIHVFSLSLAVLLAGQCPVVCHAAEENWPQFLGPGSRAIGRQRQLCPIAGLPTENVAWTGDIPGRGLVVAHGLGRPRVSDDRDRPRPVPSCRKRGFIAAASSRKWPRPISSGRCLPRSALRQGALGPAGASWPAARSDAFQEQLRLGNAHHRRPAGLRAVSATWACSASTWRAIRYGQKTITPHPARFGLGHRRFARAVWRPALHRQRQRGAIVSAGAWTSGPAKKRGALIGMRRATGRRPTSGKTTSGRRSSRPARGKVRAYDLDGKLLWWFHGMSGITIATPYADRGLLYISSGFVGDKKRPLYAIRPGGAGNIRPGGRRDQQCGNRLEQPRPPPYNPTTLVYDGRLYVLYDRGTLERL